MIEKNDTPKETMEERFDAFALDCVEGDGYGSEIGHYPTEVQKMGFIKRFIRTELANQAQRIKVEITKIRMPSWDVPELTSTMPDDPATAADQMRIETMREVFAALDRGVNQEKV